MLQMKSIKWTLLATAALASLAFALTIQQQNVAALYIYNTQSHTSLPSPSSLTFLSISLTFTGLALAPLVLGIPGALRGKGVLLI